MKKAICILIALLIAVSILPAIPTHADEPTELINLRTRTSKTFKLPGENKYAIDSFIGPIHYKDDMDDIDEQWKDIDTTIIPSLKPYWDWEVEKNNWHVYIKNDTTVRLIKDGNTIDFIYEGFAYYDKSTQEYEVLDTRNAVTPIVTGNRIIWENIFYGCDLEYIIVNGVFKENLYIKQQARDWCSANPPSSFGLSNQDSYLTGYLRCDWTNAYTPEDIDGNYINLDDYESEGTPVLWRHPVKDKIITALPLGYAIHEDLQPSEWAKIRYRFYLHTNNYNYLLFGAKVTDLNQYPTGTIILDPTIDIDVAASAEDAWETESSTVVTITSPVSILRSNVISSSRYWPGFKFSGATPSGTIDVAYMTFYTYSEGYDDANGNIYFEKVASPADFTTNNADISGRTRTTASVSWVEDGIGTGAEFQTPSLVTPLQELVDAETVTDLVIVMVPNQDVAKTLRILAYDTYPSNSPGIHVEYTAGGVSAPTVVTVNATSVEETTATLNGNITATGGANATVRGFWYNGSTVNESGNYGTGNFSLGATSLSPGTSYEYYAYATNSEGTGTGANVTFTTKPNPVTSLNCTSYTSTSIVLGWIQGGGSENTTGRYETDGTYPTDYNDGTLSYNGTGTTVNMSGLTAGQEHRFGYWAVNTDNETIYSDDSAQLIQYTLPADPANLTLSGANCSSINATWTSGAGSNQSYLRYKIGSYPTSYTDGAEGYTGTANLTTVTSLNSSTMYYFAVWAYDAESGYYSSGSSQATENTTSAVNPTVTTDNATNISDTSAQLNATISALTCADADEWGFEWGIASGNYTANWTDSGSHGNGAFNHTATGLSDNTTHYYRGFAKIGGGSWQYGGEISFTTDATPPAPASVVPTGMIPATRTTTSYTAEDITILIFPTALFLALAAWKRHPVLFMICGAASIFSGLFWYDEYTTNTGLTTGLGFIVFGLACWGYAFREMLFAGRAEE